MENHSEDVKERCVEEPPLVIPLPHAPLASLKAPSEKETDLLSDLHSVGTDGSVTDDGEHQLQIVVQWGGAHGEQRLPRVKRFPVRIDSIACGETHAVGWTSGRKGLYTWGGNDSKQLGVEVEKNVTEESDISVHNVPKLQDEYVRQAACGQAHTAAVLSSGKLICFGSNEFGQCGVEDCNQLSVPPSEFEEFKYERFIKVACGDTFTLAMTKTGCIYGFGNNEYGQLTFPGEGSYFKPTLLTSLYAVPIVDISCGESHTLALSATGSVFSWGRNKYGELGLGHNRPEREPHVITSLNAIRIVSVNCGAFHSAVLSAANKLYTFGQNNYGQCGTGQTENVFRPNRVSFFGDKSVSQVSCGRYHTICLVNGDVYGFGRNDLGQCFFAESGSEKDIVEPVEVHLVNKSTDNIFKVFAGPFSSYSVVRRIDDDFMIDEQTSSVRISQDEDMIGGLDEKFIESDESRAASSVTLLPRSELYHVNFQRIAARCGMAEVSLEYGQLIHLVTKTLSSPACLNSSFLSIRDEDMLSFISTGLDLATIKPSFERLLSLSVPDLTNRMTKSMMSLLEEVKSKVDYFQFSDSLRFIFILFEAPQWRDTGFSKTFLLNLNRIVVSIKGPLRKQMQKWFSMYDEHMLSNLVQGLQDRVSSALDGNNKVDGYVISIVLVLEILYESNNMRSKPLSFKLFQNPIISRSKSVDLNQHYISWISEKYGRGRTEFSFCKYPFILDTFAKQEILRYEAVLQMQHEAQRAIASSFWFVAANPYFVLQVRRQYLRHDTLVAINDALHSANPSVLKRPLKVVFVGEEGVDEGGVKKEFFQLIVRELFKEEFGMFVYNNETRTFWFNQTSLESAADFQLIGVILGLGIYNLTNLDIHFPIVVYKKLCKELLTPSDIRDFDPILGKNIIHLLEFDGDVENVFCLNFATSYDYFGETKTVELKPNGKDIPVTNMNRKEYVELYTKYLFADSIENQYGPFAKGFHAVLEGPATSLLRAPELEMLICGNTYLDFQALEVKTVYRGGFHAESRLITWFWKIVHEMDLESKKKLLKFTTGSDRAPLRGLGHLPFVIQNAGANTDQLPTSHTCFNTLLIPNYNSEDELKKKLYIAIQNSEGFGLQ